MPNVIKSGPLVHWCLLILVIKGCVGREVLVLAVPACTGLDLSLSHTAQELRVPCFVLFFFLMQTLGRNLSFLILG